MTTPNPQPGAAPSGAQSGQGSQLLQQEAGILAPVSAGGSSKSKYGLGAVADMPVSVGSLLGNVPPGATAEQVMQGLAHADPATIAQFQAYLYKGGFYGSSTRWQDINLGVIRPDDLDAFKQAVTTAAQTGADLSDYVRRQAAWGVYTGAVSLSGTSRRSGASAASATGQVLTIEKPDPKRIGQTIDAEFKKLLGHKPSAHERAGFIAAYTNAYQQVQIDNYNRQVAAVTGGQGGAEPISGSSAPPGLEAETERAGDFGENMRFAQYARDEPSAEMLVHRPLGISARDRQMADASSEYAVHNRNQQRLAQDQAFLGLADQPLPGMPGYSSGGAGLGLSNTQTVMQQQAYDPQAFADEWITQHHTAEAGAHSVTDVFSNFLAILHGGMQ